MNITKKVALFGTTALLLMACGEVEPRTEEDEPVEDEIEVVETQEEETVEDAEETIEEVEKEVEEIEEYNTEEVEEEGNNLPDSKELARELEEMGIETFDEAIEVLFGHLGDIEFNRKTNIYEIHPYDSDIASLATLVSRRNLDAMNVWEELKQALADTYYIQEFMLGEGYGLALMHTEVEDTELIVLKEGKMNDIARNEQYEIVDYISQ